VRSGGTERRGGGAPAGDDGARAPRGGRPPRQPSGRPACVAATCAPRVVPAGRAGAPRARRGRAGGGGVARCHRDGASSGQGSARVAFAAAASVPRCRFLRWRRHGRGRRHVRARQRRATCTHVANMESFGVTFSWNYILMEMPSRLKSEGVGRTACARAPLSRAPAPVPCGPSCAVARRCRLPDVRSPHGSVVHPPFVSFSLLLLPRLRLSLLACSRLGARQRVPRHCARGCPRDRPCRGPPPATRRHGHPGADKGH